MPTAPDAHYTPGWLADRVADEVVKLRSEVAPRIADYAAGDGALLHAVVKRIPATRVVATDVDSNAIRSLRFAQPDWSVGVCDFLNARSRASSRLLREAAEPIDGVVLNPPFSYRGGTYIPVLGGTVRASPALAFLVTALEQVAPAGWAVALIPSGAITSQKDQSVWERLRRAAKISVVDTFGPRTFLGEHATVKLVVLTDIHRGALRADLTPANKPRSRGESLIGADIDLIRGVQQMHRVTTAGPKTGFRLVHSTHIRSKSIERGPWVAASGRVVEGFAVLLPRVGAPSRDKLVLVSADQPLVLSDCVIALRGRTKTLTNRLYRELRANWDDLEGQYVGSCAPYLTVRRLRGFVESLGFSVSVAGRHG